MIDKVIIPNLARRDDKWNFMLGTLSQTGFDVHPHKDFIIRHVAHDGEGYDDYLQVRDAAIADGFDCFENVRAQRNKFNMAWFWTWNSVMRAVSKMPNDWAVLYLIDDAYPRQDCNFAQINDIAYYVKELEDSGQFKGVQLHQQFFEKSVYSPLIYNLRTLRKPGPVLAYGWGSRSDWAFLLTAECARMLMDVFSDLGDPDTTHDIVTEVIRRGETDKNFYEGFWHIIGDVFDSSRGTLFESDIPFN